MNMRFGIEIYEPGSEETVLQYLESDEPLPIPRVGEMVAPVPTGMAGDLNEVMRIEHAYWTGPDGRPKHKAMIYTRKAR